MLTWLVVVLIWLVFARLAYITMRGNWLASFGKWDRDDVIVGFTFAILVPYISLLLAILTWPKSGGHDYGKFLDRFTREV